MYGNNDAPVREGDICTVSVNAVGGKGDGIAKVKGFVLFVPNTKKGDYVKVKITKVLQNAGFAEVVEKLERPKKTKRFESVSMEELHRPEERSHEHYEDTDDFGGDLEED